MNGRTVKELLDPETASASPISGWQTGCNGETGA